ncbi:SpaH/EbpB family LPXTG-anchored major pilin [Actinomyces sp. B33]|uniref:SpaH/EbpB family LPXTG-anchored major pilin n=1 Tax=Actinomyces sp. B33 TaxID=2942131 RepID=UPI0023420E77|nr:SpaH/EbpB family LPXTG-anchored major pilin [Actinomyces sp. B33]MDC4232157.1 SpaH/EbpB family LPXTG-anchored major pilin [Actinomyces sp. B33]
MNTKIPRLGRRAIAVVGALALGVVALGSPAFAADGNIDPNAKGSILVHKYESGSLSPFGTPDGKTNIDKKTPVADVLFTAYQIKNLDLTKQADWGKLPASVPADACGADFKTPMLTLKDGLAATFDSGKAAEAKTDAQGDSKISELSVGAYLVCETEAPKTVHRRAAAFLVTIPFPDNGASVDSGADNNPDNDPDTESKTKGWLYDVNVYPKNTVVVAPTKDIQVDGAKHGIQTGEQLTFPVTAKVPSIGKDDAFKYFIIQDDFDSSLENGKVASVTLKGVELSAGQDYTKTDGDPASIAFTKAGLDKLKAAPNESVVVTFTADVKSVPADGAIKNTANLYLDTMPGTPDDPQTPPQTPPSTPPNDNPGVPTNPVASNWGDLTITKHDKDNSKALSGATFKIYNAKESFAGACTTEIAADDPATSGDESQPITVNGRSEFTTGGDGTVRVEGLFIDKKVGAAGADSVTPDHADRCYVLVETAAPAGYVLPAGDAAKTAVKVSAGTVTTDDITIDNTKQNVPQLPLTGANGQLLLTIGGVSLLLLAVGGTLVVRHRREKR